MKQDKTGTWFAPEIRNIYVFSCLTAVYFERTYYFQMNAFTDFMYSYFGWLEWKVALKNFNTTAADRQRLESFLRRARRSGFYRDDQPTSAHLAEAADDTLFRIVRYSSHHLLHTLLTEHTNHPYHLRSRTHSFKLSSQHDERNFIDRMLFPVCTQ